MSGFSFRFWPGLSVSRGSSDVSEGDFPISGALLDMDIVNGRYFAGGFETTLEDIALDGSELNWWPFNLGDFTLEGYKAVGENQIGFIINPTYGNDLLTDVTIVATYHLEDAASAGMSAAVIIQTVDLPDFNFEQFVIFTRSDSGSQFGNGVPEGGTFSSASSNLEKGGFTITNGHLAVSRAGEAVGLNEVVNPTEPSPAPTHMAISLRNQDVEGTSYLTRLTIYPAKTNEELQALTAFEPLILSDFKNSVYELNGESKTFEDIWEVDEDNWGAFDPLTLVEDVGLQTIATGENKFGTLVLVPANIAAILPSTGGYTGVIDVRISFIAAPETTGVASLSVDVTDIPDFAHGWQFSAVRTHASDTSKLDDYNLTGEVPLVGVDFSGDQLVRFAWTLTPTGIAISMNGGAAEEGGALEDNSAANSIGLSWAIVAANDPTNEGSVTIESIKFYLPVAAENLPALSENLQSYQAAAVHFDNSWLEIESLTASDNSFFSYSVWIKRGVTTDVKIFIGDPAVNYYNENSISAGQWRVEADNAAFDQIISQLSLESVSPEWVNLLCSVDVNYSSGSKILQMYINDVEVESESPPFEIGSGDPFSMVFNGLKFVVGGYTDLTAVFDAADWWIAPGQFIDFSVESNRRKFIDANGKPVDLGSDGSTPTGIAPAVFFSGDSSSFATNKGTGGSFTLVGSLSNSLTSPSDDFDDEDDEPYVGSYSYADFTAGIYYDGNSVVAASDIVDQPGRIDETGLLIDDNEPDGTVEILGNFRDALIALDRTIIMEFEIFDEDFRAMLLAMRNTDESQTFHIERRDSGNNLAILTQEVAFTFRENLGGNYGIGIHKVAVTRTNSILASSVNGNLPIEHSDMLSLSLDNAAFGEFAGEGFPYDRLKIRSLAVVPTIAPSGLAEASSLPWPNADTTGAKGALTAVPGSATSGTGWTWDAGDQAVYSTSNDAVIENLDIAGGVVVVHTGVTIKNSKAAWVYTNKSNTIFDYITVVSTSGRCVWFDEANNGIVRNSNLSGGEDAVYISATGCKVLGNYIHDILENPEEEGPHPDAIQLDGTGNNDGTVIARNNIEIGILTSSGITMPAVTNVLINNNRIVAGGWVIRYYEDDTVTIINNRIGALSFGYLSPEGDGSGSPTISGNYDDITGEPIS